MGQLPQTDREINISKISSQKIKSREKGKERKKKKSKRMRGKKDVINKLEVLIKTMSQNQKTKSLQ